MLYGNACMKSTPCPELRKMQLWFDWLQLLVDQILLSLHAVTFISTLYLTEERLHKSTDCHQYRERRYFDS